ncbi:MAG: hypothetical protein O3C05_00350 [Proteobacteria bacterium]|nr:hypothetical protein [Pseudomonadota bacterium]
MPYVFSVRRRLLVSSTLFILLFLLGFAYFKYFISKQSSCAGNLNSIAGKDFVAIIDIKFPDILIEDISIKSKNNRSIFITCAKDAYDKVQRIYKHASISTLCGKGIAHKVLEVELFAILHGYDSAFVVTTPYSIPLIKFFSQKSFLNLEFCAKDNEDELFEELKAYVTLILYKINLLLDLFI